MDIKEAVKIFRVPAVKIKSLISEGAIPIIKEEIPDEIEGIVYVDRRYNMINYLSFNQISIIFLTIIHCGFYFNHQLLAMSEKNFNDILNNLLDKELTIKEGDYNYKLTNKGEELYQFIKTKNFKFIKMLLGSAKINRIIIDKMEELL